jgi:hypothetical protein
VAPITPAGNWCAPPLLHFTTLLNSAGLTSATFTGISAVTNWTPPATNPAGFFQMKPNLQCCKKYDKP